MNTKNLNEEIKRFLSEDESILKSLFGDLKQINGTYQGDLVAADNNELKLRDKSGKITGEGTTWPDRKEINFELSPEVCKNKETLLKELKDLGVLHPETIDIQRSSIDDEDYIFIYGLVDKNNPNIFITSSSIGRGGYSTHIRNKSEDETKNAILELGLSLKGYEEIKDTQQGKLVLAKIAPYDTKKAFLIKDGKAKSASVVTLCKIIKEM